jgi:hypothetical protein
VKIAKPRHDHDCVASCYATILELPIEDVPDFWSDKVTAASQYDQERRWLAGRGFHLYFAECHARQFAEFQRKRTWEKAKSWPPRGYWIGQISRVDWIIDNEPNHVVVMKGYRCVHNPSGTLKQTKENDVFLIGYYLLVPLDPARSQTC